MANTDFRNRYTPLEQDGLIKTSEIDAERAQREKSRAR